MIGIISHLIMDTFTKEGVPWLLPLPFKIGFPPLRSLRMTTGKSVENFIVFPLLIVLNFLIVGAYYTEIVTFIKTHLKA
jgi:membrane-bound metal-dependent hydrolase YbcI (DUF457 family)